MADLRSLPALVRDAVERQRLVEEALAERAAEAERERQMYREFLERIRLRAEQRRLEGGDDPDAEPSDASSSSEDDLDDDEDDENEEDERMKIELAARRRREAERRILDYDPKQGGLYYTRLDHHLASLDLDEESPLLPMRFTNDIYKNMNDYELCEAVNIFSVKIGSLDIDFPIHVYGTVIARDSLDKKCVYLFRRSREDFQTINSKDESLILTGAKRGLALISRTYVETNLVINKGDQGQDRELSKGIVDIPGTERRVLTKCELESCSLATRLSTVDVVYGVVKDAVEATISIQVLEGEFFGEITACATSINKRLVLHDSRLARINSGEKIALVVIPLLRSVVAVYVKEKLSLAVAAHTEDGEITVCIDFIPKVNGSSLSEITVGSAILPM
ncbi:hypothetical protein BS78_09G009100 [Paspalum vaginatum]|nr:hypothetical protein BS78_09G009100 [Paspalum vaginatum]